MSKFPSPNVVPEALGRLIFANGGSMLPKETIQPLADYFDLSDGLRAQRKVSDKRPAWENRVHWARLQLANKGLLKKSIRGRWELTDAGMKHFESQKGGYSIKVSNSAIDDLDAQEIGNAEPARAAFSRTAFVRDDKVRKRVKERAKGFCEHCGELGFLKPDGSHHVEAHHIISLAKQGPDTLDNVIALCANHHREAHFGEGWKQLEAEFKAKLAKLRGK